jgi:LysM repeat protein
MKKKKRSRWIWLLGVLVLIFVLFALVSISYLQARSRAFSSRPLVLITSPAPNGQVHTGDGVIVHASARHDRGLRRLELWVNNVLVEAREVPQGTAPTTLVLSTDWVMTDVGLNTITARAFAANGVAGQSSVMLEVLETLPPQAQSHVVQPGETLASISEDYSRTPQEIASANPEIGPDGPAPGDVLVIPGDEIPPAEETVPPASAGGDSSSPGGAEPPASDDDGSSVPGDEVPPTTEDSPPDSAATIFENLWLIPALESVDFGAADPIGLQVEFLGLSTAASFEQLHCYIGAGSTSPRWYPDLDGDQTTDETFAQLGTDSAGNVLWSVETLSGDASPVFNWPANRDLPVEISCVGISAGGTDSVDLGRWAENISPERWTGVILMGGVTGSYDFSLRITRIGAGEAVPLILDPDLPSPFNTHLRHNLGTNRTILRWEYELDSQQPPIDGFRIYLNENLQWIEPADARESNLPYEWWNPPCDTTYTFGVTAFRYASSDVMESYPDIAIREPTEASCQRQVQITFLTLKTFNLGGDGDVGDRTGDIGPIYGNFYANEKLITFDGGPLNTHGATLDNPSGLKSYENYDLNGMSGDPAWRFSSRPSLIVDIPEGGVFEFGYVMMDRDSDNSDDLVCQDWLTLYQDDPNISSRDNYNGELDRVHEGTLTSRVGSQGSCEVTYRLGPAFGSAVSPTDTGEEPLPWIDVEGMLVDEDTGQVHVNVRNTGSATWPFRDLTLELQSRNGLSLGSYTIPGFSLEPGQRTILENADMRLESPFDACVVVDPFNTVREEGEGAGGLSHTPFCPPLPDLVINNVEYNQTTGLTNVTVINTGEGVLESRGLLLQVAFPDGSRLETTTLIPNVTIRRGIFEAQTFALGGITEAARQRMQSGYTVEVNPTRSIVESNFSNNTFVVQPPASLRIRVMNLSAPWNYRLTTELDLTAYAGTGTARRQVAHFHFTDMDWGTCNREAGCSLTDHNGLTNNSSDWFPILGDEMLEVVLHADYRGGEWSTSRIFLPRDRWNSNDWGSDHSCRDWDGRLFNWYRTFLYDTWPYDQALHDMGLTFQICREGP